MKEKAFLYFGILTCLLTILAGCGGQEEESGYYDILTETEQLPDARENIQKSEIPGRVELTVSAESDLKFWGRLKK